MLCRHLSLSRGRQAMPGAGAVGFDGSGSASTQSLDPSPRAPVGRRLPDAVPTLVGLVVSASAMPGNHSERCWVTAAGVTCALRGRAAHWAAERNAGGCVIRDSHSEQPSERLSGGRSGRGRGACGPAGLAPDASSSPVRRRPVALARHAADGPRQGAPGRTGGACCAHELSTCPVAAAETQQKVVQDGSGVGRASARSCGSHLPTPWPSTESPALTVTQRERRGSAPASTAGFAGMHHHQALR